jgi:mRNA-degrading endonuclease RelE of RelBE toxin-antitoxin system
VQIFQTKTFKKTVSKLHSNQKKELDQAVKEIMNNPLVGEEKVGDLIGIRVHKYHMIKQLMLLAYQYDHNDPSITLLALGTHENFYRDLKKKAFF